METTELIKKVRKIEIKTRGLTNQIFSGEYHSAFKGKGMTFSEVREYQYGDDIRLIDWNVTARFNHPYIKVYEEERELTVMLLVDVSASEHFGTSKKLKREQLTEIAAVLSYSAIKNNDKVGMILFSDRIEKFIPPKKGKTHILHIIRELIQFEPVSKKTDISVALKYFSNVIKKRAIVFLLSDFLNDRFEDPLRIVSRKHDLVALRVYDQREKELPRIGLLQIRDAESGEIKTIDTSNNKTRKNYTNWWLVKESRLDEMFIRNGIDAVRIRVDEDYVKPLIRMFKKRERRK
ncbi:MAG: DUF58 domain-containing protein [Bacteroidota bacterium]